MYICPICNKKFKEEEKLVKHLSSCWRKKSPCHKSKEAPRSEDIVTRTMNSDMENFFNQIGVK